MSSRVLHPVLCALLPLILGAQPHREPPASPAPSAPVLPAIDPAARRAGADASWWQTASARIEREEYHASLTAAGLQAPNRAHDLRTTFRSRGIEVAPRQQRAGGE